MMKTMFLLLIVFFNTSSVFALSDGYKNAIRVALFIGAGYMVYDGLRTCEKSRDPIYRDIAQVLTLEKYNTVTGEWDVVSSKVLSTSRELIGYNKTYGVNNYAEAFVGLGLFLTDAVFFPSIDNATKTPMVMAKVSF